jgi:hypothetical protein
MSALRVFALLFVGLFAGNAHSQVTLPDSFRSDLLRAKGATPHYSLSGQFIVYDITDSWRRPIALDIPAATNFVRLDPAVVAISCERIKKALLHELSAGDQWRGKIYVTMHRAQSLNETIEVSSAVFPGGDWVYRIELPDTLERSRLISAIVSVVLLETANRSSDHCAEIPAWLAQGLTRELVLSSEIDLVVDPPKMGASGLNMMPVTREGVRDNPLTQAHQALHNRPPLTFEELSWPAEGQLDGEAGESYAGSAQLFVHDLLQLNDGRECLRSMVLELPRHLNWQISFLDAFHSHFATPLELDKWWALRLVNFTGRDLSQVWSHEESWRKLDELIHTTVEVRTKLDELPMRTEVTLQTIIREWDFAQQVPVLQDKVQQLSMLRNWVSQDVVLLVDDYRLALDAYLKKRVKSGAIRTRKAQLTLGLDRIAQDGLTQLDALDARRQQLAPKPPPDATITANTHVTH